jgi:DNA invertase Pin-like site-specific DNA recombinase
MDRGYVRITWESSEDEQRSALMTSGVAQEHIYVDNTTKSSYNGADDLEARRSVINDVRSGSRVVVTHLEHLGVSVADILQVMGDIAAKGAGIHDLSTGKTYEGAILADAANDIINSQTEKKRRLMSNARKVGKKRKYKTGPKPKMVGAAKERARELYADLSKPIRQVAEETGFSATHLRRTFGNRETPRGRRSKQET